jgi:hypothetical protein
MTQHHNAPYPSPITQTAPKRLTGRQVATVTVVLIALTTLLAGCLIVPFGYGHEHRRHRHHDRHW